MCSLATIDINNKQDMVADIKKDYILNIVNSGKLCGAIKKIVLFGSSMGSNCKEESDIDIAVFGDKTKTQMFKSKDYRAFMNAVCGFGELQDYDILYFGKENKGNDIIMSDIEAGIVLYERG